MRKSIPKLNKKKTKEVIKYILSKCGEMTEKKLQLLLYFISFDFYEKHEEHLTGLTFIKK